MRVYVTGHTGLVGSAVCRRLAREDVELIVAPHAELDLRFQGLDFMRTNRPDVVIHCAGLVGGILANSTRQAEFLRDNVMMAANVIHSAHVVGARLIFLGSSCIYPRDCPQPMTESMLLTGPFEPTNEGYALAKVAGIKLAGFYRAEYADPFTTVIPCNLYGPRDKDGDGAHVLPSLIRKFKDAPKRGTVTVWGTGRPLREFMHVDDLADAIWFLLERDEIAGPINVGTGKDISICRLANMIRTVTGRGDVRIRFDRSQPDGMPRKLLDVSKMTSMGWRAKIGLREGLALLAVQSEAKQ